MKTLLAKRFSDFGWLLAAALAFWLFPETVLPQEMEIPDYFLQLEDASKRLKPKIAEAQNRNEQTEQAKKFWLGYRFELRDDMEFQHYYIHDGGGITISRGAEFYLYEDADLEAHVLHALSELGDEEAKARFKKKQKELLEYVKFNWGLFFLFDAETRAARKIKLFHFKREKWFDGYPVYWVGRLENPASFAYLKELIANDRNTGDVLKPAIFVLSLHQHPQVIPFLTALAGGGRYYEIRKTAAFWLGQIRDEASFDALVKLFEKEGHHEMRKKLVFSIGRHKSERAVNRLARIAREDRDFEVRDKAVFWLGQIEREESLDVLLDMLKKSAETRLKEKIVFAVSQHDSKRAANVLIDIAENDGSREVRKKAIFWLGQMAGRKTLQALGDIVESADETEVKTKAVFAISQHQDKDLAFQMLTDIAKRNPNPRVRKKAIFWLGQMGDGRAVDFFKDILTNND